MRQKPLMSNSVTARIVLLSRVFKPFSRKRPDGYYDMKRMLKGVLVGKGQVLLCGACMEARELTDVEILSRARRNTIVELATLTASARRCWCFDHPRSWHAADLSRL